MYITSHLVDIDVVGLLKWSVTELSSFFFFIFISNYKPFSLGLQTHISYICKNSLIPSNQKFLFLASLPSLHNELFSSQNFGGLDSKCLITESWSIPFSNSFYSKAAGTRSILSNPDSKNLLSVCPLHPALTDSSALIIKSPK